jgi:SAM-dependent methyltransferase
METNFSVTHQEYIEKNKKLAEAGAFSGMALQEWHKDTCWSSMVEYYGPTHWLDYGCGPGYAYEWIEDDPKSRRAVAVALDTDSKFTLYDPCHEKHNVFPTQTAFPGVLCVDVIEHIPETDTKATLDYLFSVCTEWMFLFISTKRLARSFDDDSGNTHCTLKTRDEWVKIINRYAESCNFPVILATDYHNNTFEHNGKHMTYDDWNMPTSLQDIIKQKREHFIKSSPEVFEKYPWELTESVFRV